MKKNGKDILCICGKNFYAPLNEVLNGRQFCSMKCSQGSQNKKVKFNCTQCGIESIKKLSRFGAINFCTSSCFREYRKLHPAPFTEKKRVASLKNLGTKMLGKKHSQESKLKIALAHLGKRKTRKTEVVDLKNLKKRLRNSLQYSNWRTEVYIRDFYTCQECHKIGGILNCHHITAFADLVNSFYLKNKDIPVDIQFEMILFDETFWDISNGQTLCLECHKKTPNFLNQNKFIKAPTQRCARP